MNLVLDASALVEVVSATFTDPTYRQLGEAAAAGRVRLIAPALLWSEATSALHQGVWRGDLAAATARAARDLVEALVIQPIATAAVRDRAWRIADQMGWARTYDAEYCAVAELAGGVLATVDARLVRAAEGRLGYVRPLADVVAGLRA